MASFQLIERGFRHRHDGEEAEIDIACLPGLFAGRADIVARTEAIVAGTGRGAGDGHVDVALAVFDVYESSRAGFLWHFLSPEACEEVDAIPWAGLRIRRAIGQVADMAATESLAAARQVELGRCVKEAEFLHEPRRDGAAIGERGGLAVPCPPDDVLPPPEHERGRSWHGLLHGREEFVLGAVQAVLEQRAAGLRFQFWLCQYL